MNSLNHYTYGSIAEWMYRYIGGLNPIEEAPGFTAVELTPQPGTGLDWAEVAYESAAGRYETRWEKAPDGSVSYTFTIPFGCLAKLTLPGDATVDGAPLAAGETLLLKAGRHTAVSK